MKESIVINYKNGSSINIEIPELYYEKKYPKKSANGLHRAFMWDYSRFVKALNSASGVVQVGKYFKFSKSIISSKEVLSVDIKEMKEDLVKVSLPDTTNTTNTKVLSSPSSEVSYNNSNNVNNPLEGLDINSINNLLNKLENLNLIVNLDKLLQKLIAYFNKSDIEFTIKAGAKKKTALSSSSNNNNSNSNKKSTNKENSEIDLPIQTKIEG